MPSDLSNFQNAFVAAVANGTPSEFDRWPGFGVYRNTSVVACVDALVAAYPATHALLGEREFRDAARDFFRANPPKTPVLAHYGEGFPEWLEQCATRVPHLCEIAQIDRLQLESHLAADQDEAPLAASAMSEEDWMRVVARTHPATRFLWFDGPAPSIWLAMRTSSAQGEIAPQWKAEGILLTRPGGAVDAFVIDRLEFELLAAFAAGEIVGAAAISAAQRHPDGDIGAAFGRLIQSGAVNGFERREKES